mmetsp:Transcript_21139/g.37444  ORF Transcript_21139/g.37444 Transcript_21139/m.37444 type:complete len:419 (-) Transcript_21139:155-1411(-)
MAARKVSSVFQRLSTRRRRSVKRAEEESKDTEQASGGNWEAEQKQELVGATLVIDNGSGMCKAGFAGEEAPRVVFQSVIGKPKQQKVILGGGTARDSFIGDEAMNKRGVLELRYPVEHGVVTNWDDMEKIWHHTFYNELRIEPNEHPILVTEAPLNPKANRERMAQILFEQYNVPMFQSATQAVLSLYAAGRTDGVVLDAGDGVTHMVPIVEGVVIPHAIRRLNVAGRDLTQYMIQLAAEQGSLLVTAAEREIARDMKEKHCFVAATSKAAGQTSAKLEQVYLLPDGNQVVLGRERSMIGEVLFDPSIIGIESAGIHETLVTAIFACDTRVRKTLLTNVVLAGGTTMLPGLASRLKKEALGMLPKGSKMEILEPMERKYSVWIGGSILASLASFQELWIHRDEWKASGSAILDSRVAA